VPHDVALISTIAAGLGFSLLGGFIAQRLGLSPIVGYLLAGVAVGPFTPGFVADTHLAQQLAEVGVILLMFGVGIHFSLGDLLAVRRIAVPGAILQIIAATAMGGALASLWGWPPGAALVFGLALSVASTVVLLRALEGRGALATPEGHIAVGWLIVEDLVTVVVLVLLPALAGPLGGTPDGVGLGIGGVGSGHAAVLWSIGLTLGKVLLFLLIMLVLGTRLLPWLLDQVARTGSRELFTLAILAAALGVAVGAAELFGVSFALGAFFAGILINASDHSRRAEQEARPLQEAFGALFFVSVGMLFDPRILIAAPVQVAEVLAIVVLGKSAVAFLTVRAFGHGQRTALTISASLAQVGEFSFILAVLGRSLGLLPPEGQGLIVAAALLSIALNPVIFWAVDRILAREQGAWRAGTRHRDVPNHE
jgi:CPA2 family monovalent cation:H+ antiporter-2